MSQIWGYESSWQAHYGFGVKRLRPRLIGQSLGKLTAEWANLLTKTQSLRLNSEVMLRASQ